MDTLLGTYLGNTRLDATVGQGGMSRIYIGYQTLLQRSVAVKVILPEYANLSGLAERFIHEARAMAALQHLHVVTIYHTDYRPVLYFEMELHPHGSLEGLVGHPVAPGRAFPLVWQIAPGLCATYTHTASFS